MERRSERWQLRGVLLSLSALFAAFVALGLADLGWAWTGCATVAGMVLGYGSAYLSASLFGTSRILRVLFGLVGVAVFGASPLFGGTGNVWGGFLYGLGFALLLAFSRAWRRAERRTTLAGSLETRPR